MPYSIESKGRIYVKVYRFLSFDKNIGKNVNNKYCQKRLDSAKKSGANKAATDAIKTVSVRAIRKRSNKWFNW